MRPIRLTQGPKMHFYVGIKKIMVKISSFRKNNIYGLTVEKIITGLAYFSLSCNFTIL